MEEKQDKNNKNHSTQKKENDNEKIDYYSDIKTNNKKDDNNKKQDIKKDYNKYNLKEIDLNNLSDLELEELLLNGNLDLDDELLSQSLKNILLDKEFASTVVIKKENKLITNFHYVTFQNAYGENSCFVNVILHLLYYITELDEFLISLYQIDQSNKGEKDINTDDEKNKFLVLLGKILYQYENIINEENEENKPKNNTKKKNQITIVKTLNMRKYLANISENKFPLNTIADPVELFNFILDILNEKVGEDLHKSFYLELIDEFNCKSKNNCEITIKNRYDKDNFIYHIYMDEILKYIETKNIKVKNYKNKLFELSYKLYLSENSKKCEKCKEEMEHNLVCTNSPQFLLINCIWKESNPIVDDVISLFFLMSLKDELNNLFTCSNKRSRKKNPYYLLGFILYSFTMSHYIICVYNYNKRVFVILDDETVKEYNNLYELILDITVNILKTNDKGFFYPVMLIFTEEQIFDNKTIRFNTLNDSEYAILINKCNEAIYEYQTQNNISEEEKLTNYQDYVEKQKEIENKILNKKSRKTNNNDNNDNNKKEGKEKEENEINDDNNNNKKNGKEKNIKEEKNIKNDEKEINDNEINNIDIKEKKIENEKINSEINDNKNENNNNKKYDNSDKKEYNNKKKDDDSYKKENNSNKIDDNEEENKKKNNLKEGLANINQTKIGQILKDINRTKGSNYKNEIYIGNFRELDKKQKQIYNKKKEAEDSEYKEKEIKNENQNNPYKESNYKRNRRLYMSQRIDDNNEDKDKEKNLVYKKRTNLADNSYYYHYNIKADRKNESDSNGIDNNKTVYNKEKTPNAVNEDGNRRKRYNINKNNITWNKRTKNEIEFENDNKTKTNNDIENKENKESIHNKSKNNTYMTPNKKRFHFSRINNNDSSGSNNNNYNGNDNKKYSYNSEKKENLYKSHFVNNNISLKKDNNEKDNNEKNNDNKLSDIQQNIRKKFYKRPDKEQ